MVVFFSKGKMTLRYSTHVEVARRPCLEHEHLLAIQEREGHRVAKVSLLLDVLVSLLLSRL